MNLNRYYTVEHSDTTIVVIDLKSVDIIMFKKYSIDFSIHGKLLAITKEVTKEVRSDLIKKWTTVREEK